MGRDPLSAAYPEEARLTDFSDRFRQEVMRELGPKLQELERETPSFGSSVARFIEQGSTRADLEVCLYEHSLKKSDILPLSISASCREMALKPGWSELLQSTGGNEVARWIAGKLNDTIVGSRKHQTLKQVIFPQAKALMIRLMEAQAVANPDSASSYRVMKQALENMYLEEPTAASVGSSAQMYSGRGGEIICNHAAVVKGNFADIAHGIIHEMAHQIDPCEGAVRIEPGAASAAPEFPLRNLLSCLQTETGLSMGAETSDGRFSCDNAAESFSDLIATALLPHLLPMIYGETLKTPDDYAQAYAGIGRSFQAFCTPVTDGNHPTWNTRINLLVASNPVMRSQMGCPQLNVPGSRCFQLLASPCP